MGLGGSLFRTGESAEQPVQFQIMVFQTPGEFGRVLIPFPILPEINIFPNDFGFHSKALKLGAPGKGDFEIYSPPKMLVVEGLKAETRCPRMDDQRRARIRLIPSVEVNRQTD
jgi:hypothetical protein